MERKIHDARASRLRDVNDKHDVGGRSVVFTEETVLRAKRGSAAGRASSSAPRLFISAGCAWKTRSCFESREMATGTRRRTAQDRVRYRRE